MQERCAWAAHLHTPTAPHKAPVKVVGQGARGCEPDSSIVPTHATKTSLPNPQIKTPQRYDTNSHAQPEKLCTAPISLQWNDSKQDLGKAMGLCTGRVKPNSSIKGCPDVLSQHRRQHRSKPQKCLLQWLSMTTKHNEPIHTRPHLA